MLVHQTLSLSDCDIKFAASEGSFSGYGSVFGVLDSKNDIIMPGAYAEVLKSGGGVPVYVNHGWLRGELHRGHYGLHEVRLGSREQSGKPGSQRPGYRRRSTGPDSRGHLRRGATRRDIEGRPQ